MDIDERLSTTEVRGSRTAVAKRIQRTVREFACRLARRSIGGQYGIVRDHEILQAFQRVVEEPLGGDELFHKAAKSVEALLNNGGNFEVSLNTTFGEPLPPMQRRATLVAPKQRVKPRAITSSGRPTAPFGFLTVGIGVSAQPVPLTYELYKAVWDLGQGLSPASLPTTVVALLDSTRARLSGPLVRDADILEEAVIRIGVAKETIVKGPRGFVVQRDLQS